MLTLFGSYQFCGKAHVRTRQDHTPTARTSKTISNSTAYPVGYERLYLAI